MFETKRFSEQVVAKVINDLIKAEESKKEKESATPREEAELSGEQDAFGTVQEIVDELAIDLVH